MMMMMTFQRFTRHSENKIGTFSAVVYCECADAHSAVSGTSRRIDW